MSTSNPTPLRIGYVPEHYLLPLHLSLSTFPFPVSLHPFPTGTGAMITSLRSNSIDLAIGLAEGWVAGLLSPQGRKQKGYSIVGRWVQSPLRWAVVTGRGRADINSVGDLGRERVRAGVSRMGSGSHVMACVLAQRQRWAAGADGDEGSTNKVLAFVPLGPLGDLIAGVTGEEPRADFFMWEHFTTKPYFHGEGAPLKKIGEIYTPWPSWCVVASESRFPDPERDEVLGQVFEGLDRGIRKFKDDPEGCVRMLGTGEVGCCYGEEDAREWLKGVEFVDGTRGVEREVLDGVVKVLKSAEVVDREASITDGDGVVGIARS